MRRRTQIWLSLLPILACLLAVRTPAPALRGQSNSSNRSRVQRPARSGGVRLEGDHHHEETPQFLVPREQDQPGLAHATSAVLWLEVLWMEPAAAELGILAQYPARASRSAHSVPLQRGPPSLLL